MLARRSRRFLIASFVCAIILGAPPLVQAQQSDTVEVLNEEVGSLYAQGKYGDAISVAERSLALAERTIPQTDARMLTCLDNLALLYMRQTRYADAERLYKRSLAIKEQALGKDDDDTLDSVFGLASVYRLQGRYVEAEPLHLRAAEARKRGFGMEHASTLEAFDGLTLLYLVQGRYDEAEPIALRVKDTAERKFGKEAPATLRYLGNLASVYREQGRYKEAEPLLQHVAAAKERALGKDHYSTLIAINNLAEFYSLQGRTDEAEQLYKRALEGKERTLGSDHASTLTGVNNLADLYSRQGRHKEAEALYQRALAAKKRTLGAEHPLTIAGMRNLAQVYRAENRIPEAQPLLEEALALSERTLGPDHPSTLIAANNLASVYRDIGQFGGAESLHKRVLSGYERTLGPEHPLTLIAVNNLAYLYRDDPSRSAEAEALLKRALEARQRVLGPDHPDALVSVNNLAAFYFGESDWKAAANYWHRSTSALVRFRLRSEGGSQQGQTGKQQNRTEKNSWQFRGLIRAMRQLSDDRADAASTNETFEAAQWAVGSEAAQSLAEMAARGARGDAKLAGIVRERQDLVTEWQKRDGLRNAALGEAPDRRDAKAYDKNLAKLAELDERIAAIDGTLSVDFPDYASLVSATPLSMQDVQKQLAPDEALVMFLDTAQWQPAPNTSFIWVVTKSSARWARSDLGTEALSLEVAALRCGLDAAAWAGPRCPELTGRAAPDDGQPLDFDIARAHRLYRALFGDVEDLIKGKSLLLVPSGPLTQLPFQVLVTVPPAKDDYRAAAWLARDHALTVLPAVSSLKALRQVSRPSAAAKPMIGFGNPLLDGPDPRYVGLAQLSRDKQRCPADAWERTAGLFGANSGVALAEMRGARIDVAEIRQQAPLPETADELCAVARDIGADVDDLRLGARATEREVKALSANGRLAQYRILHFATHGVMAGELTGSGEPGLLLTPPADASAEDDGYLSASEIAALKLDAEWVILSACNTAAAAAPNAEALSGLARAFIYAQTRALLVSHWAVDSDATVKLITSAMREIARDKTVSRAEAVRRAMLDLIDKGETGEAHPAYWAPFIVVGEGGH
jgi:CHAT domain-containing protein/tetratricopeptide (TPR) repeat protein